MYLDTIRMTQSFWYLASPYSHSDPLIEVRRAQTAMYATAWLLAQRVKVFSPIHHCHSPSLLANLPGDADYWREYDQAFIRAAAGVIVLTDDGWRESRGVTSEVAYAQALQKPIYTVSNEPHEIGVYRHLK